MTFTRINSTDPANLAFLMNRLGDEILASTASSWAELPGKPAAYPPTPHTHAWGAIQGRPAVFPPSEHRHAIDDVSGLRALIQELGSISGDPEDTETLAALLVRMGIVEGNVDQLETLAESLVRTTDERLTDARTPLEHQHTPADVTGLEDLLTAMAQRLDALSIRTEADLSLQPGIAWRSSPATATRIGDIIFVSGTFLGDDAWKTAGGRAYMPAGYSPASEVPIIYAGPGNVESLDLWISSGGEIRASAHPDPPRYIKFHTSYPAVLS